MIYFKLFTIIRFTERTVKPKKEHFRQIDRQTNLFTRIVKTKRKKKHS